MKRLMTQAQVNSFISRLKNCLDCLAPQNSGADIHEINTIRHNTQGLIRILEADPYALGFDEVEAWCKRCENAVGEFFKKKYQHVGK